MCIGYSSPLKTIGSKNLLLNAWNSCQFVVLLHVLQRLVVFIYPLTLLLEKMYTSQSPEQHSLSFKTNLHVYLFWNEMVKHDRKTFAIDVETELA